MLEPKRLEKIHGVTYADNTASKKVLENAGFIFVKNDIERNYCIYVI